MESTNFGDSGLLNDFESFSWGMTGSGQHNDVYYGMMSSRALRPPRTASTGIR